MLTGLATGAAIMCKWLTALIVLPVWLVLCLDKEPLPRLARNLCIMLVFCSVFFLPWQLYTRSLFPAEAAWEASYNAKHITEALEGHAGPFYYHFQMLGDTFGIFIWIPVLWFLATVFRNFSDRKFAAIAIWFLVPYLFFSIAKTKMPAYTLFASPAVFIIIGLFIDSSLKAISGPVRHSMAAVVLALFLVVPSLMILNEAIGPFEKKDRNPAWAVELRNLDKTIKDRNTVIFNSSRPIETMFYSPFTAYRDIPTQEQVNEVRRKGYNIYVVEKDPAPISTPR